MFEFVVERQSRINRARRGVISTVHGTIETPAFVPVGTQATVKGLTPAELMAAGAQVVFVNAYHLFLRPGTAVIKKMGGLHQFMQWPRPIMTDSGGFQAFSLGLGREHGTGKLGNIFPAEKNHSAGSRPAAAPSRRLTREKLVPQSKFPRPSFCHITAEGVEFRSHLDGRRLMLTPEKSIRIQNALGGDIIMAFDECTSPLSDRQYTVRALNRTHQWAIKSIRAHANSKQALYGIVQGGEWRSLRQTSARFIADLDFAGFAVGGSLGKSKKQMTRIIDWVIPELPPTKPRHLLGIGAPEDILEGVRRGIDSFDCAASTREARHGRLYQFQGPPLKKMLRAGGPVDKNKIYQRLAITQKRFREDRRPIDPHCSCYTCRHFSRAYLAHLYRAGEMLGPRLGSIHNLYFMHRLMRLIREAI